MNQPVNYNTKKLFIPPVCQDSIYGGARNAHRRQIPTNIGGDRLGRGGRRISARNAYDSGILVINQVRTGNKRPGTVSMTQAMIAVRQGGPTGIPDRLDSANSLFRVKQGINPFGA